MTTINQTPNFCGSAQANSAATQALITQPTTMVEHTAANGDHYLYTGPLGGTVVQFKLATNPDGTTKATPRTILTGISLSTGLGVADDLGYGPGGAQLTSATAVSATNPQGLLGGSLMVMTDPSAVGLAGQGVMTRLPLCEDIP